MRMLLQRKLRAGLLLCSLGVVGQFWYSGCADYGANLAVASFDFCTVLNCTGSTFVNLCDPPILVDCPAVAETNP